MTNTPTTPSDTDVRTARRELKRAERALDRASGGMLTTLARERRDAAALRFIALTGDSASRTVPGAR